MFLNYQLITREKMAGFLLLDSSLRPHFRQKQVTRLLQRNPIQNRGNETLIPCSWNFFPRDKE
jgi:hypothetical protein